MNLTGVRGTGNILNHSHIESTGIKIIQKLPISPAERLPEQWNVPPKNNNFIGRHKLIKQIEDHFSQKNTPAILTACHGLGGIGKT